MQHTITDTDNEKRIQVHVNDEINISLNSNPSTGYRWAIEKNDETLLTLKQSHFTPSNHLPGSGGTELFTFVGRSAGVTSLQLKYWRSFVGDTSVVRRFGVIIEIQA